jgi:hypothetical protein
LTRLLFAVPIVAHPAGQREPTFVDLKAILCIPIVNGLHDKYLSSDLDLRIQEISNWLAG